MRATSRWQGQRAVRQSQILALDCARSLSRIDAMYLVRSLHKSSPPLLAPAMQHYPGFHTAGALKPSSESLSLTASKLTI